MNCFKCSQKLKDDDREMTDGYTIWQTNGNYGSSVFDPIDFSDILKIYICDDCLHNNKDNIRRYEVKRSIEHLEKILDFDY